MSPQVPRNPNSGEDKANCGDAETVKNQVNVLGDLGPEHFNTTRGDEISQRA
jgi:hypothetical protein